MIAILVLAAGSSSRMRGRDKLLEDVEGMPLLRRQVMRAVASRARVFVTLPTAPHPRYDTLEGLDVTQVPVRDAAEGMSASVRAGIASLPSETEAVMILLADMPDITLEDINTVMHSVDLNSEKLIWRGATQDGAGGHPTVFHGSLLPELAQIKGDAGARELVRAHAAHVSLVPLPDAHARVDLDTPEAWAKWRTGRPLK